MSLDCQDLRVSFPPFPSLNPYIETPIKTKYESKYLIWQYNLTTSNTTKKTITRHRPIKLKILWSEYGSHITQMTPYSKHPICKLIQTLNLLSSKFSSVCMRCKTCNAAYADIINTERHIKWFFHALNDSLTLLPKNTLGSSMSLWSNWQPLCN